MSLLLITIFGTFAGTMLALEAKAWAPQVSARVLRVAVGRFPAELEEEVRSRWTEEIEADLASYDDRPLGGLLFVLRLLCRGGRELAAELALQQALANSQGSEQVGQRDGEKRAPASTVEAKIWRALLLHYIDQQIDEATSRQGVAERNRVLASIFVRIVSDPRVAAQLRADGTAKHKFVRALALMIAEGER
jgi:hypothetical protein